MIVTSDTVWPKLFGSSTEESADAVPAGWVEPPLSGEPPVDPSAPALPGPGLPPAGTPPGIAPPAGAPPTGAPPAGAPPAGAPPAGPPPAGPGPTAWMLVPHLGLDGGGATLRYTF
ncbi:MAG: hypothetical protein EXR75_06615 [Myxococcales bacterium]|nr:hypothetical protein [Myxococcales bacterium]